MLWSFPVVLASGSPRRKELLATLIPEFEVLVSDVDEDALTVADPVATAEGLAAAKARAVQKRRPGCLVIGGDTVVAVPIGEQDAFLQLSKPVDAEDACRMLRTLSGRTHQVITGLAVLRPDRETVTHAVTEVTFRELSDHEISEYVATGEPMDKAGAYAIQGGASGFVSRIHGSTSNVIGLPMEILSELMAE